MDKGEGKIIRSRKQKEKRGEDKEAEENHRNTQGRKEMEIIKVS